MKKKLKFWGTRGSCAVSGPEYQRFGGNTCCVELDYQNEHLIIDAGTGIRPLGLEMRDAKKIDLFLTHFHWDHILGFPFFEPVYEKDTEITIWTPHGKDDRDAKAIFEQLLAKELFPIHLDQIRATLKFKIIREGEPVKRGPLILDFCHTHHTTLTYSFKIKTPYQTIGYVSDNEVDVAKQQELINFHKGCDIFIHEAQYSKSEYDRKKGWGHACLSEVTELVKAIRPGKWLVIHHDPEHTDADLFALEKVARASDLPCPVEWIGDGHTIDLL
jgi:phosphoribosyl 1,2-cyclic phosphodiesterase